MPGSSPLLFEGLFRSGGFLGVEASSPSFFEPAPLAPGVLKTRAYHAVPSADFSPDTNQAPYILLSIKVNTEGSHKRNGKEVYRREPWWRKRGGEMESREPLFGRLAVHHCAQKVKKAREQTGDPSAGQTLDSIFHLRHVSPCPHPTPDPKPHAFCSQEKRAGASPGPEGKASRPAVLDLPSGHSQAGAWSPWYAFKAAYVCYLLEHKKRRVLCFGIACMIPLGSPSGFYDK